MLNLLPIVLFAAVCSAAGSRGFSSPVSTSNWAAGTTQIVQWTTDVQSAYTFYLWQQWPTNNGANNLGPIYQAGADTVGNNSFPWTVSYYGANLTFSTTFFIWTAPGNVDPDRWISPYFQISQQQVVNGLTITSSSTHSSTTAASGATTTAASGAQTTTLSTTASSATTGSAASSTNAATSAAANSSSGTAVGVGVGVGVGVAILILGLVAGYFVLRRRKRAAAAAATGAGAGAPGDVAESYYKPMYQNQSAAPPYEVAAGTLEERERKNGQSQTHQLYEAPTERPHAELP